MSSLKTPFFKMHGLGNDFVFFDFREAALELTAQRIVRIADRHRGVGFDQMAVLTDEGGKLCLTFYNADGSVSAACGNATRCVARYIMDERSVREVTLTTAYGDLHAVAQDGGEGLIAVNMGVPQLAWRDIPLAQEVDVDHLPIEGDPVATSMGNPHCTFFVEDAEAVGLSHIGPQIENHALFPDRTNVQFAHVMGRDHLRMRVWERGTGITMASGSSTCATVVAAARRGLTSKKAQVDLDGGTLWAEWRDDGVWLTGPTAHVFTGTFTESFWDDAS